MPENRARSSVIPWVNRVLRGPVPGPTVLSGAGEETEPRGTKKNENSLTSSSDVYGGFLFLLISGEEHKAGKKKK